MIRKLIRKDLAQIQALRGGHGWDRPDVPLNFNPPYKHKREVKNISIISFSFDFDHSRYQYMN